MRDAARLGLLVIAGLALGAGFPQQSRAVHCAITWGDSLFHAGVWVNGKWIDSQQSPQAVKRYLPASARWGVYNLKGQVGQVKSSGFELWDEPGVFGWLLPVEKELQPDNVAITGTPRTKPVVMKPLSVNNSIYQRIVANFVRQKGLKVTRPRIRQLFCQDLNGDGVNEAIINVSAQQTRPVDEVYRPYSFVLFRYLERSGKVKQVILSQGEASAHRVLAVLDIQGDRKVEIVLYYKCLIGDVGGDYLFFEYDGRQVKRVLTVGYGM